ncbi:hypothetical protein [Moraxella nonliquefaciens]|uniref:hypothetical protein n=1 Tax=Moraxella nonliquefaciens TaxID=478 RepID=UPI002A0A8E43|nr:hypothetical protein [Moraxella nonliquefaciens]
MDNENHSKIISKGQSVGYIRVSSVDQNTERQLDNLTWTKYLLINDWKHQRQTRVATHD